MTSARTFSLITLATVLSGWLSGAALERSAVGMRVWQTLGVESWVHFSQGAILGTGLMMEGVIGVAAAALIFAAAVSATFDRSSDRTTPISLILAIVFSLLGLLFTAKAVNLQQLLAASQSPTDLQPIFDAYLVWGVDFRAAADAVAFVAVVWALLDLRVAAAPEKFEAAAATQAFGDEVASAAGLAPPRELIAEGTPEQIARNPKSYTEQYRKPVLARQAKGGRRAAE
jgi:hypothetical protein